MAKPMPPGRKVAFYAPLRAPDHPAPSGERQMARLLMAALARAGYEVSLASDLRTYLRDPGDHTKHAALIAAADHERHRIVQEWRNHGPPDLWMSYHPYYKSPDLLGPTLCIAHKV
ncbi:MAG: hypothetical protein AAGB18_05395, partial [Pseudomonadota bacterium]